MNKNLPIVTIVGQPNSGKSTLMNKILRRQLAVTSRVTGTTRDRQYADTAWNGVPFTLVDTAGLTLGTKDQLELSMNQQIDVALREAAVIIFVVDGKEPVNSVPQAILHKFRKTAPRTGSPLGLTGAGVKKPLLLCVNKVDSPKIRDEKIAEFKKLGIKKIFPTSALTGAGIGDMMDEIAKLLPVQNPDNIISSDFDQFPSISVSIVGKPNVGKSSIFNKILNEERVVVSPVPGTTRAAIDSDISIAGQKYNFIDTAGLKKKAYRQEEPDVFSGFQTFKSIRRSDVCFFVINSVEEITKQDQRVAQEIFALEKGCIILANKVDIYKGDEEKLKDYISLHFPFLWMCPVFFVSGKTGQGLMEALEAIKPIYERRHKTLDNQTLSEFLSKALAKNPPRLLRDQKKPKVFSLKQIDTNPPHFELLVNHPAAISQQFRKFLENSLIKLLDFWGTPIVLKLRGKDKS